MALSTEELLAKILGSYENDIEANREINAILVKIAQGTCTMKDALALTTKTGKILGEAFRRYLTAENLPNSIITQDIADKVIWTALRANYDRTIWDVEQVQTVLYENGGLRVLPKFVEFDGAAAQDLADRAVAVSAGDRGLVAAIDELQRTTELFSQKISDTVAEENVRFASNAKIIQSITRTSVGRCCAWCRSLTGSYKSYAELPEDFFRRHQQCNCVIDVKYTNGEKSQAWAGRGGKEAWVRGDDGHWYKESNTERQSKKTKAAKYAGSLARPSETPSSVKRLADVKTGWIRV